eukprot:3576060-Alexandrium_andersonii.AAC.1
MESRQRHLPSRALMVRRMWHAYPVEQQALQQDLRHYVDEGSYGTCPPGGLHEPLVPAGLPGAASPHQWLPEAYGQGPL